MICNNLQECSLMTYKQHQNLSYSLIQKNFSDFNLDDFDEHKFTPAMQLVLSQTYI